MKKQIDIKPVDASRDIQNKVNNIEKQRDTIHPSKDTQREIASRYGGEITNMAESRA